MSESGAHHPRVFVVSGPSGVGKSTIIQRVLARVPELRLSVSLTTRAPRPGEEEGVHYHFVSRAEFEAMIARDEFMEWATVYDQYYGTSRPHVEGILAQGRHALLDVDTQGAMAIRERYRGAVLVFIKPPHLGELERRLRSRGTEDEQRLAGRMAKAEHEISFADRYDYVIVNDRVDEAVDAFIRIIHQERERSVNFTQIRPHADDTVDVATEKAVRYALERINAEAIVQTLEGPVRQALFAELEELIRQRLEHVLADELPAIVEETYRVLRARGA